MNPNEALEILWQAKFDRERFEHMSPKDRVNMAISHKFTDRIPFDFWASPDTWSKFLAFFGNMEKETILELLCVDCRIVMPRYIGPAPVELENDNFVDELGSVRRYVPTPFGHHKEFVDFPLKGANTVADVEGYQYLPKPEYWDSTYIETQIDSLNKNNSYHIRVETCGIFEYAWALFGLENFLMHMAEDNMKVPNAIMSIITELFMQTTHDLLANANGKIDMVYIYDDIGTQSGPMISVPMWKKFILPWYKKFLKDIQKFDVQIMYHSCGSIYQFIPHLMEEMEIDVLNPLQPLAKNMDIRKIKNEFGDRLAFHGAIDIQELLPFGDPKLVKESVESVCGILNKGSGYICAPAHYLQADVPIENIVAMYSTQRKTEIY